MFEKMTMEDYCEILSSSAPAPGGGSALAEIGAIACSLIEMAANVTLTKSDKNDENYEYLHESAETVARSRKYLHKLANDDAAAYENIVAARKLPKNNEQEIKNRTATLQKAFHKAALVPLDVMGLCLDVLKRATYKILPCVTAYVKSDCEIGINLLKTVITDSSRNVYANTCFIRDGQLKQTLEKQGENYLAEAGK